MSIVQFGFTFTFTMFQAVLIIIYQILVSFLSVQKTTPNSVKREEMIC